jgi:hypothetical protein
MAERRLAGILWGSGNMFFDSDDPRECGPTGKRRSPQSENTYAFRAAVPLPLVQGSLQYFFLDTMRYSETML